MHALEGTGVPEVTFFARIEHKSKWRVIAIWD